MRIRFYKRMRFADMKKILTAFGLLLLLAGYTSCSDFQEITFSGIENVKVTKLSKEAVEADIIAKINNPNRSGFTVYHSDMDVTFNGISCGKAKLTNNVKIKGESEQTYTFHVRTDLSNLSMTEYPKLLAIALSKHAKISLKGNLNVGKLFVKKQYPVEFSKLVSLEGI